MKHKKPKSASKKKNSKKQSGTPNKPKELYSSADSKKIKINNNSVDELIKAGDSASAATEHDKALAFFASAEVLLREETEQQIGNTGNNTTEEKMVQVLEKLGEVKATLGDHEGAKKDFQSAIALWTAAAKNDQATETKTLSSLAAYQETLAGLHLYVGQLSSEEEALQVYKQGLACLERSVAIREEECENNPPESAPAAAAVEVAMMDVETNAAAADQVEEKETPQSMLQEARRKLASARATVAELYLTDLCFAENAESECESYVALALEILDEHDGEPMVDALQTAASLRVSQQRNTEACQFILRVYEKMKTGCEALAKLVGLDDENKKSKRSVELEEVGAVDSLPSFDFRCQTAKLLLECGAADAKNDNDTKSSGKSTASPSEEEKGKQACLKAAVQVLGSLLAENDDVPEVWYLTGCAYGSLDDGELALHYWSHALEMLEKVHEALEREAEETADMQDDDANDELDMQLQSIACQMEEIRSKLEDVEDGGDDDDDDDSDDNSTMEE